MHSLGALRTARKAGGSRGRASLRRVREIGGDVRTSTEVVDAAFAGDQIRLSLNDGSTLDVYDDETLDSGTWEIVDDEGVVLLHVVMDGLDYDYEVAGVMDEHLWLIYLARGNSLHYSRVAD